MQCKNKIGRASSNVCILWVKSVKSVSCVFRRGEDFVHVLDLKLRKKKWCRRRALVFVFDEMNYRVCVSCNLFLTRRRSTREKKVSSLLIQQQFPFLGVFERETDFQRFWTELVLEEKQAWRRRRSFFFPQAA